MIADAKTALSKKNSANKATISKALAAKNTPSNFKENFNTSFRDTVKNFDNLVKEELAEISNYIKRTMSTIKKIDSKSYKVYSAKFKELMDAVSGLMADITKKLLQTNGLSKNIHKHLAELSSDINQNLQRLHATNNPSVHKEILKQTENKIMGFAKLIPGGSVFSSIFNIGQDLISSTGGSSSGVGGSLYKIDQQLKHFEQFVAALSSLEYSIENNMEKVQDFIDSLSLKIYDLKKPNSGVSNKGVHSDMSDLKINLHEKTGIISSMVQNSTNHMKSELNAIIRQIQGKLRSDIALFKSVKAEFEKYKTKESDNNTKINVHKTKSLFQNITGLLPFSSVMKWL